jgi:hypothetical protein
MEEEIFKIRILNDESIRWQCKQRVKLHLNNIKTKETGVEKNLNT